MDAEYSTKIAQRIEECLDNDNWQYSFNKPQGVFEFSLIIESRLKRIGYTIIVGEDSFTVYATSPVGADRKDRQEMSHMAEFLCRANYGLKSGNFEMDFLDGEIRYKVHSLCDGIEPSEQMIRGAVYTPAAMFDRFGPGLLGIIFEGLDPEEAISVCEHPRLSESRALMEKLEHLKPAEFIGALADKLGIDPEELMKALEDDDSDSPKQYDA